MPNHTIGRMVFVAIFHISGACQAESVMGCDDCHLAISGIALRVQGASPPECWEKLAKDDEPWKRQIGRPILNGAVVQTVRIR